MGVDFVPVAVESLGGWSEEAIVNIKKIDQLLGQRTGSPLGTPFAIFFNAYQSPYGEGMSSCGGAGYLFTLLGWMGMIRLSFLFFCFKTQPYIPSRKHSTCIHVAHLLDLRDSI